MFNFKDLNPSCTQAFDFSGLSLSGALTDTLELDKDDPAVLGEKPVGSVAATDPSQLADEPTGFLGLVHRPLFRSEERRVGKEGQAGWGAEQWRTGAESRRRALVRAMG